MQLLIRLHDFINCITVACLNRATLHDSESIWNVFPFHPKIVILNSGNFLIVCLKTSGDTFNADDIDLTRVITLISLINEGFQITVGSGKNI